MLRFEGLPELNVESMTSDEPRTTMAEATLTDTTLSTARALAGKQSEGYYWVEGLVFRTRLDRLGQQGTAVLACPVPRQQYWGKCLTMANEHFGHPGRNKMGDHIRKFFYRPSITADSIKHVKSCMVCLKKDKANPRPMLMQEKEVVMFVYGFYACTFVHVCVWILRPLIRSQTPYPSTCPK